MTHPIESARTIVDHFASVGHMPWGNDMLRDDMKTQPLLKRMTKLSVMHAVATVPSLADTFVTRPYRKAGYEVLGYGYHSMVLATGQSVLKAYRHTADLSDEQKAERIIRLEAKQEILLDHMARFVVPQTFAIEESPIDPNKSMIIARQQRVAGGKALNIHAGMTAFDGFGDFIHATTNMYHEAATLPDIAGVNNIFATANGLKVIDTIPLVSSDPNDHNAYGIAERILGLDDRQAA